MIERYLIMILVPSACILGVFAGVIDTSNEIEKKCMYEHRVEFSGQLYSCQWLEGVTLDNQPYERKPHPLKEILK